MPTKVWVAGEEVLASDWNTMVQEQVVATFATAAARTAALPTPKTGQVTFLLDVARDEQWNGSQWIPLNVPRFANASLLSAGAAAVAGALAYNVATRALVENGDGGVWRAVPGFYTAATQVGTAYPTQGRVCVVANWGVYTTSGAGAMNVAFVPALAGWFHAQAQLVDPEGFHTIVIGNSTASSLHVIARQAGGAIYANGTVRTSYFVVGWA